MSDNKTGKQSNIASRPPIITIMGHVDHGKTSILDILRKTDVVSGEFGGITQHIGAYQIEYKSQKLTFIDTPGHAAFSQMRARGGKAADIVILVVSAEEGVKTQTKEAILHARAANVPMIVAITKMDLPNADPKKVKQELAAENVMVEDWGGDVVCVEVSSKTNKGINELLDAILTVAELANLKADEFGELEAVVIEARSDPKKGVVVSAIVKNGSLHVGDKIVASGQKCSIKSLMDDNGALIKTATPSTPVEILGFSKVPNIGDLIVTQGSELEALSIDTERMEIIGKEAKKMVTIIVRADTSGTLEAIKSSLADLVTSSVGATFSLKFLICATGDITDSDVLLAQSSKALIVGFNSKLSAGVADLAESMGVIVKVYKTIYELVDEVRDVLEGTAFAAESKIKGRAKVLKIFKLESGDVIAGCKVLAGAIKNTSRVSIYEKDPADLTKNDTPLYTGNVKKLKKGKEDVVVVGKDNDCGLLLRPQFDGIREGLWIEVNPNG